MLKVFALMFTLHLIMDFLIFLLANIYILISPTIFDAVNNSLSILITSLVHTMGSKFFLVTFVGSYNTIYSDPEYLSLSMENADYKPIEFLLNLNLNFNTVLQVVAIVIQPQILLVIEQWSFNQFMFQFVVPYIIVNMFGLFVSLRKADAIYKGFNSFFSGDLKSNQPDEIHSKSDGISEIEL